MNAGAANKAAAGDHLQLVISTVTGTPPGPFCASTDTIMLIDSGNLSLIHAAIQAELQADPAARGYAGKAATEIADLLNSPVDLPPQPAYRDLRISNVNDYLAAHLVIERLHRQLPVLCGDVLDAAEALLRILADTVLQSFPTSDHVQRQNVLCQFATLVRAGAGGLTLEHYADLVAMAVAPVIAPTPQHPRWLDVLLSLPIGAQAGLPNKVPADWVTQALA
jgi:hypothetical protein